MQIVVARAREAVSMKDMQHAIAIVLSVLSLAASAQAQDCKKTTTFESVNGTTIITTKVVCK